MTATDSLQERMRRMAHAWVDRGEFRTFDEHVDDLTALLTRVRAEALEEAAVVAQRRDVISAIEIRALAMERKDGHG